MITYESHFLGTLAAIAMSSTSADTITGRVIDVHDGDTLTLQADTGVVKVRFAGIDAPELKQPFGRDAQRMLAEWALGKEARVESAGTDRYGRALGVVYVSETNLNARMVENGAAWVYRAYPFPHGFDALETQAKAAGKGLWALPHDQRCPPWDFRKRLCAPVTDSPQTSESGKACGLKRTCKEMTSCDEAKHYLTNCGVTSLDGNDDGIPCASLCKR